MASWTTAPARLPETTWTAWRQVDPLWPPLFHAASEPSPSQDSGRWHRLGEGYAQYLALDASGAWTELIRNGGIRGDVYGAQWRRRLWIVSVQESEVADLSTFDRYAACGLDPKIAIDADHAASQALADDLRAEGFRGVLSPSASLPTAVNLTLFGPRYEKLLPINLGAYANPKPGVLVPCQLVAESGPPVGLIPETAYREGPHEGYERWVAAHAA